MITKSDDRAINHKNYNFREKEDQGMKRENLHLFKSFYTNELVENRSFLNQFLIFMIKAVMRDF